MAPLNLCNKKPKKLGLKHKITAADHYWEQCLVSSADDYEDGRHIYTYPCTCSEKVSFNLSHLDKHRFLNHSNLNAKDVKTFLRLSGYFKPFRQIKPKGQHRPLTQLQRFQVLLQRVFLSLFYPSLQCKAPKKVDVAIPDSFIDFYCPHCKSPVSIHYASFIGGQHCEHGYILKFVITRETTN